MNNSIGTAPANMQHNTSNTANTALHPEAAFSKELHEVDLSEGVFTEESVQAMLIHLLVELIRALEASSGEKMLPAFVNYDNVNIEDLLAKLG